MVGAVDTRAQIFRRGDAGQVAELVGQVRLVRVTVIGGRRGPVDLGPPVQVLHEPLHPLHPAEPLGAQPHLGREPPPQRPGQQAEILGGLRYPRPPRQRGRRGEHRRIRAQRARQVLAQHALHHIQHAVRCPRVEQPLAQCRAGPAPQDLQRHQFVGRQAQRRREEAARPTQREAHRHVPVSLLELERLGAAGRPGQHGARNPPDPAVVAERAERITVEVDPQPGLRRRQDLLH
jgi:hypothetical protein